MTDGDTTAGHLVPLNAIFGVLCAIVGLGIAVRSFIREGREDDTRRGG